MRLIQTEQQTSIRKSSFDFGVLWRTNGGKSERSQSELSLHPLGMAALSVPVIDNAVVPYDLKKEISTVQLATAAGLRAPVAAPRPWRRQDGPDSVMVLQYRPISYRERERQ